MPDMQCKSSIRTEYIEACSDVQSEKKIRKNTKELKLQDREEYLSPYE